MPWRSRLGSWLGVAVVAATAAWSVLATMRRAGPWPHSTPDCPQDFVTYVWATGAWARGASPWTPPTGAIQGVCPVVGNYLYPAWTLPPLHALFTGLDVPTVAPWVVGACTAAGVAQLVVWARWGKVNPVVIAVGLYGMTSYGDRFSIGASPGNMEALVALALSIGAIAWWTDARVAGAAIMAVAAAAKPDHAPWILAVGWALGDLRLAVLTTLVTSGLVCAAEPMVLGKDAFGWVVEMTQRATRDEPASTSTLFLLRRHLVEASAELAWLGVGTLALIATLRAGRRLPDRSRDRLLLAWLLVLLLLPRVKDYAWMTAYGPLLAAWWAQPWSLIALPVGEMLGRGSPEHTAWIQSAATWLILVVTARGSKQPVAGPLKEP